MLISPSLYQTIWAQENWTTLFQDDFEDGNADAWELQDGWEVRQEGGNYFLSGSGHSWARLLPGYNWTDYEFTLRVQLIHEAVHLNVRHNDIGRYYIGFHEGGVTLSKQFWPDTFLELAAANFPIEINTWHTVSITVQGNHIGVMVDGVTPIDYSDGDNPLLYGSIALETVGDEDALVHFDNVQVTGEPPPPPPPLPPGWAALFEDDFEDGFADGWNLELGWDVTLEGGNFVLRGQGHHWAEPVIDGLVDCVIEAKIKLLTGGFHFVFRKSEQRVSDTETVFSRYFLGLSKNRLSLNKQIGMDFFNLYESLLYLDPDSWHVVRIVLEGKSIKVYLDNALGFEFTDSEEPLLFGTFAFETLEDSQVHFDDVVFFGAPPPTPPPGYTWTKTGGPSGGLGYDVRIHPLDKNIMYVTDNPSGVNKSCDAGATWGQRNEGITTRTGPSSDGIPIFSLTIDPNDPNIVWAGTQNAKGIYKSTDGGETWAKKDNGVAEGVEISFRNFGVHPHNSNIVFAGAELTTGILGIEFDKTKGKIYKTEDGGENWSCVWDGDNLVRFVLFNPTNPDVIYASTGIFDREAYNDEGIGVLKSENGGQTWVQINNGIPNSEGNRFVGFLEMHPTNTQMLFAASGNNAKGPGGIFRTTTGGVSWQKVLSDDIFTVVTISPSNTNVIYAGSGTAFYRSNDGGNSWQKFWKEEEFCWGPPGIRAGIPISAVVDPYDPMTVFANNYGGGNFKSTDGGQTWVNSSKGYTGAHLHDIAVDVSNPAYVYSIGRSGPFRSFNGGHDWAGLAFPPATQAEWNAVSINPANSQEVLVADEIEGRMFKSTNGGNSWRLVFDHPDAGDPCNSGPQECRHGFKDITYAPSDTNIVYAGMRKGRRSIDGDFPARPSFGIYKSTDGGETWFEINNGLETSLININCIAIHPNNADIVYAGTWRDGVFKTTDGGQSWIMMNNGLVSADVRALAIDLQNPEVVYAGLGAGAGIFKTTNGGELWEEINNGLNIECPSYLLPIGRGAQKFTLEQPPRRFISTDYYSVPWTSIWSIVIDPTDSQTLYAADHQSGVHLSTDGGASWVPINQGLSTKAVTAMAISSHGKVLYAATEGEGVFRIGAFAEIDIKPGCEPNSINCTNKKERIPVAILTTSIFDGDPLDFDVTAVDHTTITFEGASETRVDRLSGEAGRYEEDVDSDGDVDLVFHFLLSETNLTCDSTEGTLIGQTFDGQPIVGTDSVRMVRGGSM
jgi:photosystem II stability/assembly factor-like uncharacterized protein